MSITHVATFIRTKNTSDGKQRAGFLVSRLYGEDRAYPEAFVFMPPTPFHEDTTGQAKAVLNREFSNPPIVAWLTVPVSEFDKVIRHLTAYRHDED